MINKILKNSNLLLLIIVFIFTILLRVIYVYFNYDPVIFNKFLPFQFDNKALILVSGGKVDNPTAWGSYYLFISFYYFLLRVFNLLEYRLIFVVMMNIFLAGISVCIYYKINQIILSNKKYLLFFSSLIFSLYYPFIYINTLNISENIFIPLFLLFFYINLRNYKNVSMVSGILLGLMLVLRPIILTFIPFYLFWIFFFKKEFKIFFYIKLILSIFVIVFFISLINSYFDKDNKVTFSESSGVNFALSWCSYKKITYEYNGERYWFSPPVFWNDNLKGEVVFNIPFSNQLFYYNLGFECLKNNPSKLLTNINNIVNIFSSNFYPNFINSSWHIYLINFWKYLLLLLVPLFFLYFFVEKNISQKHNWFLALFAILSLYVSVYLGNPGEERYLIPYYFIFLLWSIATLYKGKKIFYFFILFLFLVVIYIFNVFFVSVNNQRFINNYFQQTKYVISQLNEEGFFNSTENMTRKILTIQGLVNSKKYFIYNIDQEKINQSIENLKSYISFEKDFAYLNFGNPVGETSFTIMTLIDDFDKSNKKIISEMGKYILSVQSEDGFFEEEIYEDFDKQRFISGQASLTCVYLFKYLNDPKYLKCAEKAYNYYSKFYKKINNASFYSWQINFLSKFYEIDKKRKYLDDIKYMSNYLISIQEKNGGFSKKVNWYTSSEAVFTESLINSYKLLKKSEIKSAYLKGISHIIENQLPNGAVKTDEKINEVSLDNNGHSMMMFYTYFKYYGK